MRRRPWPAVATGGAGRPRSDDATTWRVSARVLLGASRFPDFPSSVVSEAAKRRVGVLHGFGVFRRVGGLLQRAHELRRRLAVVSIECEHHLAEQASEFVPVINGDELVRANSEIRAELH